MNRKRAQGTQTLRHTQLARYTGVVVAQRCGSNQPLSEDIFLLEFFFLGVHEDNFVLVFF